MIGSDQVLNIIIKAKDDASKTLEGFKGKVENMEPAFKKMAAIGTAAFVGIAAVAYKSVEAYAEVERANRQLEHAVIAVSKGTKEQVAQIDAAAQALQKKAGVDADSLKMGAAQLSTFGLQSASVVKLTKTLADFTVNQKGLNASSDDYIDSANTLAKALNGQFGVLEKSGIRFTEAQQKLIEFGSETEKVAALQEGLAQNLRETTDTVAGLDLAQAKMKRTMEDIQENIGKALAPAFASLLEKVSPVIEKFAAWAENNPELLAKIILVAGAIAGLVAVLGTVGLILPSIIAGVGMLGTALAFLAANPIVLVVAAFVGLVAILDKIIQRMKDLKGISASAAESAAQSAQINQNLAAKIATTTDPAKKAKFEAALAQGQEGQKTLESVANAGFFKNLAVGLGISKYEHGGMIPGAVGQEVPIIAHGGETIIPAGQSSRERGDMIFNFSFNGAVAGDEGIKRIIKETIRVVDRQSSLRNMAGA